MTIGGLCYIFRPLQPLKIGDACGIRTDHRTGSSCSTPYKIKNILWLFYRIWRGAQYLNLSRLHRTTWFSSSGERKAVELAIKLGLGTSCRITPYISSLVKTIFIQTFPKVIRSRCTNFPWPWMVLSKSSIKGKRNEFRSSGSIWKKMRES